MPYSDAAQLFILTKTYSEVIHMEKLTLNGAWTLDIPGSAFPQIPAAVPGSVSASCVPASGRTRALQ